MDNRGYYEEVKDHKFLNPTEPISNKVFKIGDIVEIKDKLLRVIKINKNKITFKILP